jgi:hypothetical protein
MDLNWNPLPRVTALHARGLVDFRETRFFSPISRKSDGSAHVPRGDTRQKNKIHLGILQMRQLINLK